jgi:hypothetical protein
MRQKELNEFQLEREMKFIQIPGPNPILVPGDESAWDGNVIETCYAFKDGNTYYLYYHAKPKDEKKWPRTGYRVGVATAPHPLGPWTKYEGNPIIDLGPEGGWEDRWVACASVLKEEGDKYFMWYSGNGHVGLAYASNPLGPWKKYEGNPVLEDFGYLGSVVKVNGKYRMYNEYPISGSSPDQGPFALAIAEKPEGPWEKYEGNPILPAGEWGTWDDGGFSEAGVMYHDGVYHIFYGGTKWRKLESIGYAYSLDGYDFIKHSGNPVAPRENNPDASAFAEAYAIWEPPFYYVYHTLRYISKGGEDLGVQILATETPFRLAMPVLSIDSLAAGTSSELNACPPISLARISDLALTAECTYHANAKEDGMLVHVRASYDGVNYDTADLYELSMPFIPGKRVSKTVELDAKVMFIKVIVENLDASHDIADVKVTATLGSQ